MRILPNNVAVIDGDTHHAVWCATEGLVHDKWMAATLKGLIRDHGVSVAVDGGANIGTLTRPMLDAGCRVWAFEPNPEAADCLEHNCPEAIIVRGGLGREHTRLNFNRDKNAGASHLSPGHLQEGNGWLCVPVGPLDSHKIAPGLIKLDLEGYEVHALAGAEWTIKTFRPVIVCEVNSGHLARYNQDPAKLFSMLGSWGYEWRVLQPDCKFGDPQYDIVATPKK